MNSKDVLIKDILKDVIDNNKKRMIYNVFKDYQSKLKFLQKQGIIKKWKEKAFYKDICYDSFECRNPENYYYSYKIKFKNLNK